MEPPIKLIQGSWEGYRDAVLSALSIAIAPSDEAIARKIFFTGAWALNEVHSKLATSNADERNIASVLAAIRDELMEFEKSIESMSVIREAAEKRIADANTEAGL